MKTIYLVANWKSNKTVSEAKDWLSVISRQLSDITIPAHVTIILCAPFTISAFLQEEITKLHLPIQMGVQTVSSYPSGAYTGEVSAEMLKGLTEYVLIGHSERRRYFHETDEDLKNKSKQATLNGLKIIYCVEGVNQEIPKEAVAVLYEPQSAIGSGKTEDSTVSATICQTISEKNNHVPVLYGGSVTEKTLNGFLSQPAISGVAVGGASLKPEQFIELIKVFSSYV